METTQLTPEYMTDIERETNRYLARIRQVDKILEHPVKTLIRLADEGETDDKKDKDNGSHAVYFPTWISEGVEPGKDKDDHRLTQALCCGTLQRVWRLQRRLSWLDKKSLERLEDHRSALVDCLTPKEQGEHSDFWQCVELLHSETFGGLNPLTASQVFRVLLEAGEDKAHGSMGFVAFFAMVWPLCRRFPDPLTIGARIEPWEVTAYITEKCLLPGKTLHMVLKKRAGLLDDIGKNLVELKKLTQKPPQKRNSPGERWLFNVELDDLSVSLWQLSAYSINKTAFSDCAKVVQEQSDSALADFDCAVIYKKVLVAVGSALISVREKSKQVLADAETVVTAIRENILNHLETRSDLNASEDAKQNALEKLTAHPLGLRFAEEYQEHQKYWEDLAKAAKKSCKYCEQALKELRAACHICPAIEAAELDESKIEAHEASFIKALEDIAEANRKVRMVLDKPVRDATRWCRTIVDREIAHASAENITDFDPSELVSAIAVAVRWNLMTTPLQVSDAVTKALAGARGDGSWRPGKPFYSSNHAFGIWAATSDTVWTLTSAIEQFRGVTVADEELFNYVNWLERTQVSLIRRSLSDPYVGWPSERLRDRRKIYPGITALSINALLEIRDLAEYRLWQLCKKRFSVVKIDMSMKQVDPVDLGAAHPKRLHCRLVRMAREAQGPHFKNAEYSLVLHGPPGSSKTKVAEALSAEMWKTSSRWGPKEPRLIRITPADFTRLGEDRLDSEARVIFDLISRVRAVTIFFDEIDDLLRQRNTSGEPPRFMDLVVPAMLNRLADLRSACPRQEICFLLATNYVESIDAALIRKGRIDNSIPVVYPDFESRVAIISKRIGKGTKGPLADFLDDPERHQRIASCTGGWPYLAITSFCDVTTKELQRRWTNNTSTDQVLFEGVLNTAIADLQSSFSNPAYGARRQYSQELLNEYFHHAISCCDTLVACEELVRKQTKPKTKMRPKIVDLFPEMDQPDTSEDTSGAPDPVARKMLEMLNAVLKNEGRWGLLESRQLDSD